MTHEGNLKEILNDKVLAVLRSVISAAYPRIESNELARALFFLLLRAANTWRSIRTLDMYTSDKEGPMVDAGALLRVMFDAYIQAEYICCEADKATTRARDYLDFEHVEKYRLVQRVTKYDNSFVKRLMSSPQRPAGETRVQEQYDRVKGRYLKETRRPDGTIKHGPGARANWYPGTLADLARSTGKSDEYDILLATFHGCVHSSSLYVRTGPVLSRKHILDWASTIAARIAQLNVKHNSIALDESDERILAALCKPYFS